MKFFLRFIFSFLIIMTLFGTSFALVALGDNLRINEIAWMGTTISANDEWLELKNNFTETIDLTGWQIVANDGIPTIALSGSIEPGGFYLLERSDDESVASVPADLIYTGALVDGGEFLELKNSNGEVIDSVNALAGWLSGDKETKQTMEWSGTEWVLSADVGGTPKSERVVAEIAQTPSAEEATSTVLQLPNNTGQSVNTENIINTETEMAVASSSLRFLLGDVVINEVLADPLSNETEWVELFNNTKQKIDLSNWLVVEGSGKETIINGWIEAQGYLVVENIKGNLNNDGDLLILRDANKNLLDKVTYGNWNDGQILDNAPAVKDPSSIARKIDGYSSYNNSFDFVKTDKATKGAGNLIINSQTQVQNVAVLEKTASTTLNNSQTKVDSLFLAKATTTKTISSKATSSVSVKKETIKKTTTDFDIAQIDSEPTLDIPLLLGIEEARKMEKGTLVLVEGVVTVLPGVLGSQFFYINASQKSEAALINFGLQVYSYKKDFPDLHIGDRLEVLGEISEVNGEKRLKTLTKGDIRVLAMGKKITPQAVVCEEINNDLLGSLVSVEGEISDLKATGIYLDDGFDEVHIYLKKTMGINHQDYEKVANIKVTGIISAAKNEIRLLPRSKDDIIILNEKENMDEEDEDLSLEPKVLGATQENSDLLIEPRNVGQEAGKYILVSIIGVSALSLLWFLKFKN